MVNITRTCAYVRIDFLKSSVFTVLVYLLFLSDSFRQCKDTK